MQKVIYSLIHFETSKSTKNQLITCLSPKLENKMRTNYPNELNKGLKILRFPEEDWRIKQPKCVYNNQDKDTSLSKLV